MSRHSLKGIIPGQRVTCEKLERARELRRQMTPAERILWQELRGDKLGVHFRRQQIIAGFIADFYCHRAGLAIELDGDIHQGEEQRKFDAQRETAFRDLGLRLIRFKNTQIEGDLSAVLGQIRELIGNTDGS